MPVLGFQKGEWGVLSRGQSGSLVHIARLGKYEALEQSPFHCRPVEGLRDQDSVMQPLSTCACLSAVKVEDGSGMRLVVLTAILMCMLIRLQ